MAAEEQSNSNNNRSRKSKKRPRAVSETKLEQLDSLSWKPSVKEIDGGDGDLSLFVGSDDLQGGFLSLEEIDEVDYGLEILNVDVAKEEGDFQRTPKSQKTASSQSGADDSCLNQSHDEFHGENQVGRRDNENDPIKQKGVKKKNKGNRRKNNVKNDQAIKQSEPAAGNDDKSNDVDASYLEEEYSAWNELRLHPLIMKSICRLKFKKPTEVQRACIPAAAHQGKDVIGAAETGSGKTLAFGLPIFQRFLEEREKAERLLTGVEDANERVAPHGVLRALIVTPTRELALQVTDHLKAVAVGTNIRVVPVVGGMSTEKQERLLKARPEIVVGTPGRLWEIMSRGEPHLVELHSLSFFVLDEADRMIEAGHFSELQSIIDMLPIGRESTEIQAQNMNCVTVHSTQRKKRQTFVFSATLSLSSSFRRKLKSGKVNAVKDGLDSIESLSQRAGMRANTAIVDLTNASVLVRDLVESVINCTEEEKDGYLYYILSVHGQGRTIVFCTSISALRRISSILRILHINVWNLHSEMQQRARLKSVDHFRATEDSVLIATDAAARGLDIPGVRTVIHYQLPLSADVYVHRCGRTARASTDGCSIALISPTDASNFASLSKSFQKESFQQFPVDLSYMQDIMKRSSLAHQIDKISRNTSKEKAERNWLERNAEALDLDLDEDDSEEERMKKHKQKKAKLNQLNKLQQELDALLAVPLQPKTFSRRFLAGAGISPLLQCQFEAMAKEKLKDANHPEPNKRRKFVVIGQDFVEPLQALKSTGTEACLDLKRIAEKKSNLDKLRRQRKEMKKRLRDERKNQKRKTSAKMLNDTRERQQYVQALN